MGLIVLLALQAAAAPASTPPPMARIDFDLTEVRAPEVAPVFCEPGDDEDDIVVCGRALRRVDRFSREEMAELARRYAEKPVRAEMDLGGGTTGSLSASGVTMPDGNVSNRVMVGIKLPF